MRRLILGLFALIAACTQPAFAQKATPPKLAPCDTASLFNHVPPFYGVGQATITKACPGFVKQATDYVAAHPSISAADLIAVIQHGKAPGVVAQQPPAVPAPTPTPAPVPTPAPQPSNGDIAFADFSSGIAKPFSTDGNSGTSAAVVDDPTGSGHGKVAKLSYSGSGTDIDANRAVYLGASLPSHFFFSGDVYFPAGIANYTNTSVQRKLVYNREMNGCYRSLVIFQWGDQLGYDIQTSATSSNVTDNQRLGLATVTPGVWHRLEYEVQWNSAPSVSDGTFRLWLDGKLISEQTKIRLYVGCSPGYTEMVGVGYQREGGTRIGVNESSMSEVRYWDNLRYSPVRVP